MKNLIFNYQPLANQIGAEWVSVEYPADYYRKAGANTGYMRDEVYSFFIRWVYDTGDKTPSFHIPGRYEAPGSTVFTNVINDDSNDLELSVDSYNLPPQKWRVYNTAQMGTTFLAPYDTTPDGGQIIAAGKMAYWESSERYDDDKSEVWNASSDPIWGSVDPAHDLCGKQIRHHKFPSSFIEGDNETVNHFNQSGTKIRVMSIRFNNIKAPLDNQGNTISNITGYEILRGSREGNKSVFAKGMINDMLRYELPESIPGNKQGLYPNYPYNDVRPTDPFLTGSFTDYTGSPGGPLLAAPDKFTISFHSPDFEFRRPYLNGEEIVLYQKLSGDTIGKFVEPSLHPEHILFNNLAVVIGILTGIGYGLLKQSGKRGASRTSPRVLDIGSETQSDKMSWTAGIYQSYFNPIYSPWRFRGGAPGKIETGLTGNKYFEHINYVSDLTDAIDTAMSATEGALGYGLIGSLLAAVNPAFSDDYSDILDSKLKGNPFGGNTVTEWGDASPGGLGILNDPKVGFIGFGRDWNQETPPNDYLPAAFRPLSGVGAFFGNFGEGFDALMNLIYAWSKREQYAVQYQSHCFYNKTSGYIPLDENLNLNPVIPGQIRRRINEQAYLGNGLHDFSTDKIINNVNRSTTTVFETFNDGTFTNSLPQPSGDDTKRLFSTAYAAGAKLGEDFSQTRAASHYAAVKQLNRNQYGQIESIIQVPVSTCKIDKEITETDPLFNGDIYIGRYTEKNTMFFYSSWLNDLPELTPFDYSLYPAVPYPRFGMNTTKYNTNEIIGNLIQTIGTGGIGGGALVGVLPGAFYDLDEYETPEDGIGAVLATAGLSAALGLTLVKRKALMYLFNSGVRDFFVESEINIEYRDWGNDDEERHYDYRRYTNLSQIFDQSIIKSGNFYKYDTSFSVSFLYKNLTKWGFVHSLDYDPSKSEECFSYRPNRLIYSLPQNESNSLRDFWKIFLPFNREDFKSRISAVKPLNQNGALILFDNEAPKQFLGTDTIQLGSGNKVTIGDGGLFNKPLQSLASTDEPYEYGSCQNRLSVINTAAGVFWISQNQGKIFNLSGGMKEISSQNMKWWLASYLPYKLTEDFPDFDLTDNPVAGIGCQTIFDNENQIVYFCKKDYKLRTDISDSITYVSGVDFLVNKRTPVTLGDSAYFEDASWTISYDPKIQQFISYHDWHPDLLMPSKGNFLTIKEDGIWKHNDRCDSYCNFYGTDYPFEVEYAVTTPQMVNTLRSVEYYMEAYKYSDNCYDRFHVLDYNFDEAIIYNSEQCSGLLDLNLSPKNNAPEITTYPKINPTSISILFSKEEQKYRFNQFWDITADRGEFNPAAERMIFNTAANGYVRELNAVNLDYNKAATQRKKF